MKISLGFVAVMCAVVAVGVISNTSLASNYPPGYVIDTECKENEKVKICTLNRRYGAYPSLRITYKGGLMQDNWGRINAVITLNSRTHMFKMNNSNFEESLVVGALKNVKYCVDGTEPKSGIQPCGPNAIQNWEYDLPSVEEFDLFYYARTNGGTLGNAWDVSVAFVSESGQWDSKFGANYVFRFE